MDGCAYPFDRCTREALKAQFGYENLVHGRYWDHIRYQIEPEHWRWVWREGIGKVFNTTAYVPGAPSVMRKLAAHHELVIITNRPKVTAPYTYNWLAHHRVQALEVHVLGPGVKKSDVKPVCDVYIEDKPSVVDELLLLVKPRPHVFMPARPWNVGHKAGMAYDDGTGLNPDGLKPYANERAAMTKKLHRYNNPKEVLEWVTTMTP
jgi:hypothetical protein